jgi:hypothetical protein
LASMLTSTTGTSLTNAIANLTVVSSGQSRNFATGDLYVSTIGTTAVSSITHADPSFATSLSNIPADRTFVYGTLPLTVDSNSPALSTGKIMVFSLKNGTEDVSSGFSINLKISGVANSALNQRLYVQDSVTGVFSDSGFEPLISGSDLDFTLTHFSNYVLVNAQQSATSSTSSATGFSQAASGGGGGGCFLRQ